MRTAKEERISMIKCAEGGSVPWVLQTQAASQPGPISVAYTLAMSPFWFSHPNTRYFSNGYSAATE